MTSNEKEAARKLTLRQCFDTYYIKTELAPNSLKAFHFKLMHWEACTANPPIGEIDDELMETFRTAALEKWTPYSVNSTRTSLRAICRRLGPQIDGNPTGLGVIDRVPYMRPCKVLRELPRRISLEDLSRWYIAAGSSKLPHWGGLPGDWWRAWLVTAYFTGWRKQDVFNCRFADVDMEAGTALFRAQKTQKPAQFPLHPCVIDHLRRIQTDREFVFQGPTHYSGHFNQRWNSISDQAGIERFTPHDCRRVAGSEAERVKPGMAAVLLQHRFIDVTHASYLNQMEELAETIAKMRVPVAFGGGIKMADRQISKAKRENSEMMRAARMAPAGFPDRSEWQFSDVGFAIRGAYCKTRGGRLLVMRTIATSKQQPVDYETICEALWPDGNRPPRNRTRHGKVCWAISVLRNYLRHALHLPPEFDPIPCVKRGTDGNWSGQWTVCLPTAPSVDVTKMQAGSYRMREALDLIYLRDHEDLAIGTKRVFWKCCNRWQRLTRDPAIDQVTADDFIEFRGQAARIGYAASTIDHSIQCMIVILRHCAKAGIVARVPVYEYLPKGSDQAKDGAA